ncbi:hypothetical protein JVU11DRAFT_9193 [Chiua virens]|nr:hypothetical protein JVU11DRAFT_9193 [Chiua virens]
MALQILRRGRISLLDRILDILDPSKSDFVVYRTLFFTNPSGKFTGMLDLIFENDHGRVNLLHWMEPHATKLVSEKIADEMDDVKSILGGTSMRKPRSDSAKQKNKFKSCNTACNVIIAQLAKERSQLSIYFAAPFTLFLWTNGAGSRQTIEALHKCGLCISFPSLTKLLNNLTTQTLEEAARIARGPHVMCYDNINISTSIFVEQRASAPAKVQSGTFAVLYEVRNGDPAHMRLSPTLSRAQQASDLTFNCDVLPSRN